MNSKLVMTMVGAITFIMMMKITFVNCYIQCFDKENTEIDSCSGIGMCIANNTCSCDPFLATGDNCEKLKCAGKSSPDPTLCNGRGICNVGDCWCTPDPAFSAQTHRGFNCEIPVCFTLLINPYLLDFECGGHGKCIDTNICECKLGYGGYDCTKTDFTCYGLNATDSNVCSGRGQCIDQDYCLCRSDIYYGGSECSIPKCNDFLATDSQVCYGRGQCIGPNQCSCQLGFSGTNCEQEFGISAPIYNSCFGILSNESLVCSGRGSCLGNDYCSCQLGYTGSNCEETFCFGIIQTSDKVCSGKGNCSGLNSCTCINTSSKFRHTGEECEVLQCLGNDLQFYNATDVNVCSGRGECRDCIGCVCRDGYHGDSCQLTTCFSVLSNLSNTCSGNGVCSEFDYCECYSNPINGYWSGDDCSTCSNSYGGSNCSIGLACQDSTTCLGSGKCLPDNTCSCDYLFDGKNCEECSQNHYGPLCDIYCSSELNCSSNGACSRDGFCDCYQSRELGHFQSHNCSTCSKGYFGLECSTFIASNFTFNKYGNELMLNVVPPLDINIQQTENMCKTFFSPISQSLLGNEFTCQWIDVYHGYLRVFIPQNATIVPGDVLEFNVYAFEKISQTPLYSTITSLSSEVNNIITPYPNIEILSKYESGKNIDVIGKSLISVERERALYYEWTVLNSASLNSYINAKSGWGKSTITIPSNYTSSLKSVKLKLRIANYYQQFGSEKVVTLQDASSGSTSAKQVMFRIVTLRNPIYILTDTFPYKINTELIVNGEQISSIEDNGYNIEWILSPDLGLALSNLTLTTLRPTSKENTSVLFTSDDLQGYEFYNIPYTVFNATAVLSYYGSVISSDSLIIHFNLYEPKNYGISISKSITDIDITAQYPIVITLTIPPEIQVYSIEWSCVSTFMYNYICHEQYRAIIDQSANMTTIELPKSAVFLHYNTARFNAKIFTNIGIENRAVEVTPAASFRVLYASTETAFFSSGYMGTFRLYSLHGTLFNFEYRLFDSTEPSIGSGGDAPSTSGYITAYHVYNNSQITLSSFNGITNYTDTYLSGPYYAKKVLVDMKKFSAPIYFQVRFIYKSLEMNMRQYLIIGPVPKEIVTVSMKTEPLAKYPELTSYTFQISYTPQHSFYEVKTAFWIRYRNSTSMIYNFAGLSMLDANREVKIALPPLLDNFTIYQKVTYYYDSWVYHEHEQELYMYDEEIASIPATSTLSSDPFVKAMQLRIRASFEKKGYYIASAISNILSYYIY